MSETIEKLTTEHDIYISVGLKNPMKPSTFKEIIDSLLFENIGYMTSWGTHTKDEWIQIATEQEVKINSQKEEIEGYKAITELAVMVFEQIRSLNYHGVEPQDDIEDLAKSTIAEINRLSI